MTIPQHSWRWFRIWAAEQHAELIFKGGILSVPLCIKRNPQGGIKYVPSDLKELKQLERLI